MNVNNKGITIVFIILLIIFVIVIFLLIILSSNRYKASQALSNTTSICPALSPPGSVTAISTTPYTINVSWSPVLNASRYHVYLGTVSSFTVGLAVDDQLVDTTGFTFTSETTNTLTAGVQYFVYVTSVNNCNIESPKSLEASVIVSFPPQFKIANRTNPFKVFGTSGGSTTNIELEVDCQNSDTFCYFTYNYATQNITPVANPAFCLASFPDAPNPDIITLKPCASLIGPNAILGQWVYREDIGALCHITDPTGLQCTVLDGPFTSGSNIRSNPYDFSPESTWDILSV